MIRKDCASYPDSDQDSLLAESIQKLGFGDQLAVTGREILENQGFLFI